MSVFGSALLLLGCASNPFAQRVVTVSEALARPETFHGHTIELRGYMNLRPLDWSIYNTPEECEAGDSSRAVALNIPRSRMPERWHQCGAGWAVGAFNMRGSGHMGLGFASLDSVGGFGQFEGRP